MLFTYKIWLQKYEIKTIFPRKGREIYRSQLEKDASTVSPLGRKKAASRVMPLLLSCLEQAAGYLGTDIFSSGIYTICCIFDAKVI